MNSQIRGNGRMLQKSLKIHATPLATRKYTPRIEQRKRKRKKAKKRERGKKGTKSKVRAPLTEKQHRVFNGAEKETHPILSPTFSVPACDRNVAWIDEELLSGRDSSNVNYKAGGEDCLLNIKILAALAVWLCRPIVIVVDVPGEQPSHLENWKRTLQRQGKADREKKGGGGK